MLIEILSGDLEFLSTRRYYDISFTDLYDRLEMVDVGMQIYFINVWN